MGLIWVFCLGYWSIISIWGDIEKHNLYLNYKPMYIKSISNLLWPILLVGIFVLLIKIFLHYRKKRILEMMNAEINKRFWTNVNSLSLTRSKALPNPLNNVRPNQEITFKFKKFFKLSFRIKLLFIIILYWIQWYLNTNNIFIYMIN